MGVGIQSYKENSIGNKPKNQIFSQMHFYGPSANLIQLSSSIMTKVYIAYVFGQDQGYMVKKNLCLKEFPRAKPNGTSEGKGLYLTVHPESSPNTTLYHFNNY